MSLKNLKKLCKFYYPLSVLAMSWILMTNCVWHDLLLLKPWLIIMLYVILPDMSSYTAG